LKRESVTCLTSSWKETIGLGQRLGACLREGDILALAGDLGSGKTCLAKGLALGLGVPPDIVITSPSFALMNAYEGRCMLFHIDVYRLETVSDFLDAGLEEYLQGNGVVVMEWADRWPEILPEKHLKVRIKILDEHSREIILSGRYPEAARILREVKKEVR